MPYAHFDSIIIEDRLNWIKKKKRYLNSRQSHHILFSVDNTSDLVGSSEYSCILWLMALLVSLTIILMVLFPLR